jgi:hypothetical protein
MNGVIFINILLDSLPKWETGGNKGKNNWSECKGKSVIAKKNDVEYIINILDYNKSTQKLTIQYLNKPPTDIATKHFLNGHVEKYLFDRNIHNYKIGDIINTKVGGKIQIIDTFRKIINGNSYKYYRYECLICGWKEGEISEGHISERKGCSCCSGHTVVEGINDIPTTNPEMVQYFQGGYEEAKLYTKTGSGNPNNKEGRIFAICPICKRIKDKKITIYDIYKRHSIGCSCSDSIPYPEKFVYNMFEQLGVNFEYHKTFNWSKNVQVDNPKLCGRKSYDFYLNDCNILTETHGIQHYKETNIGKGKGRTYEEEVINDRLKQKLAIKNGIKEENYIVIDCRYSNLDWIKNSILKNEKMNNKFDLSKIDWLQCHEFACNTRVKEACNILKNNKDTTPKQIGILMKLSIPTIIKYLRLGNDLHWCNYNAERVMKESGKRLGQSIRKPIICINTGQVFESATNCSKRSIELFKIYLSQSGISSVCLGKSKSYKNLQFKFITSEEYNAITLSNNNTNYSRLN